MEPGADHFVEELDPPRPRVRPHDRKRPAHRNRLIHGHMGTAAGLGASGAAGCFHPDDVLLAVESPLVEDPRFFEEDRPAVLRGHSEVTRSITVSSTAMRTATPLRTCSRMTDCGPSATSEEISMPRFMGCGCITMASGLATASRSGVSPYFEK